MSYWNVSGNAIMTNFARCAVSVSLDSDHISLCFAFSSYKGTQILSSYKYSTGLKDIIFWTIVNRSASAWIKEALKTNMYHKELWYCRRRISLSDVIACCWKWILSIVLTGVSLIYTCRWWKPLTVSLKTCLSTQYFSEFKEVVGVILFHIT